MGLVPNDKVQVSFRSVYQAQRILMVTNWVVNVGNVGTTIIQDLTAIGAEFGSVVAGKMGDRYRDCLGTDVAIEVCRVQQIRPVRSVYIDTTMNNSGTGAGIAGTGNIASILEMASASAGRSQHSNLHIGPIPQVNVVAGGVVPAQVTVLNTLGTFLLGTKVIGIGPLSLDPVVLHPPGVVPSFDLFSVKRVPLTARVMRRRTVGVGE